tara:strand:- start:435 stop:848 length:414 start_codon:yes stop_codon:yes gene_type:complete
MRYFSDDIMMCIFEYLNYEEMFYKDKSILSKNIHKITKLLLIQTKLNNEISHKFLSLCWEEEELKNIPIILYKPFKMGQSLKTRLFNMFDSKNPHKKLFVANIYKNELTFMVNPILDQILWVEYIGNKLNYNIYTRM